MQTQVLTLSGRDADAALMQRAAAIIRSGGLVAFPTETVYGLGADALNPDAVAHIFAAKQRPLTDPIIVHIADRPMLDALVSNLPPVVDALAARFWPGPLTLILPRSPAVPSTVTAGGPNVAVRMPAHPVALDLIRAAGTPIAAPSANRFSRPSATTAAHVLQDLDGAIDAVLDGGPTPIGVESTIVDLTAVQPVVLRPGGVTLEALRDVLPGVMPITRFAAEDAAADAPGQFTRHYAPRAEVLLFPPETPDVVIAARVERLTKTGTRVGLLALDGQLTALDDPGILRQPLGGDLSEAAQRLFAALRALDEAHVNVIVVRGPDQAGIGTALWDRLLRAADGRVQPAS